jgi:hypothetical protein
MEEDDEDPKYKGTEWLDEIDQALAPVEEQQEQLKFENNEHSGPSIPGDSSHRLYPIMMYSGVTGYITEQAIQDTEDSQHMTQPDDLHDGHDEHVKANSQAWHALDRLASCTMHLLVFKNG